MSKTFKTNKAYHAHKTVFDDEIGCGKMLLVNEVFRDCGQRHGNHRKWKAAAKVQARRNERRKLNSSMESDYD